MKLGSMVAGVPTGQGLLTVGVLGMDGPRAHIPGVENIGADAISRDNLILFHLQCYPQGDLQVCCNKQ